MGHADPFVRHNKQPLLINVGGYNFPCTCRSSTNDLKKPAEEIGEGGQELITAEESTVITKLLFDVIVVGDC